MRSLRVVFSADIVSLFNENTCCLCCRPQAWGAVDKEQESSKSSSVREKVGLPAVMKSLQNVDIATDLNGSPLKDSNPYGVTSVQQEMIGL